MLMWERDCLRQRDWGREISDVLFAGYYHPSSLKKGLSEEEYGRTRDQWTWSNHLLSLLAALQIHPCGGGAAFRPMLQFMTRYSKFFWHEDWRIAEDTYRRFAVDTLREIWWEEVVYERETDKYRETVVNLINSPDSENAHARIFSDPEIADDVELACLKMKNKSKVRAWAMRPYEYDSERLEPVQAELNGEVIDGELVFKVPPFRYFSLVVLREYGVAGSR